MTQTPTYSIFFKGEAAEGSDLAQVKLHFAKLFKADDAKLAQLFSGSVVTLKKNIVRDDAAKFQQLFKKTGAKIYLKEDVLTPSDSPTISSKQPKEPPASEKTETADTRAVDTTGDAPYQKLNLKPVDINSVNFDLSPYGADMLDDADKHPFEALDIDLSDISVAETGSTLGSEPTEPAPAPPSTDHISTADLGETLGSANADINTPIVDIPHFSIAETGADLQDFIDDIPDFPPETDHLSLAPAGGTLETLDEKKQPVHPDISHISLDDSV